MDKKSRKGDDKHFLDIVAMCFWHMKEKVIVLPLIISNF